MKKISVIYSFLFISLSFSGCADKKTKVLLEVDHVIKIPKSFPNVVFPPGNEYTLERWSLGKKLFYETRMSQNNAISCASCHKPQYAFSDNTAFSIGNNKLRGRGNTTTLTNIAYNPYFTRAGGVPTLEMQILVPIQEHDEFNTNILDIVKKLKKDTFYEKQSRIAYNRELDPYVITRAIANFERSFISLNSKFDRYFYHKEKSLSQSQIRGYNLFKSKKTNCFECHSGFNFTNYAFENNGLYKDYQDTGRMRLTHKESDEALFKVPTLRNIALTAPYMHDGSIESLKDVITHYNTGGKAHQNKSPFVRPLGLNQQEQEDLVAFLESLTDYSFVNNRTFYKTE
jgi:cytochrome c peroxidase